MKTLIDKKWIILMLAIILSVGMLVGCSKNNIKGSWVLVEMQIGQQVYGLDEFASAINSNSTQELVIMLDIDDKGNLVLHSGNSDEPVAKGQYTAVEKTEGEEETINEYIFSVDGGNNNVGVYVEDGKLILHDTDSAVESKMIFEKQ